MAKITPRSPFIAWDEGFKKHWNGSPALTHPFNALSFMFPQGESFFIKVVKETREKYADKLSPELEKETKAFILQEATHVKHHQRYNKNLEKQGYENVMYGFINRLVKIADKYFSSKHRLAIVCAYEHYTAILGNYVLSNPEILEAAPKNMTLIWEWHAAEETEHKAVCFDLYTSIGGSWLLRVAVLFLVSLEFAIIFSGLYFSMLWRDGALKLRKIPSTVWQAIQVFWGRKGGGWHVIYYGLKYLSPYFHPWNLDNKELLRQWLVRNNNSLEPLSTTKKR